MAFPVDLNLALKAGHENDPITHGVVASRALYSIPQKSLPPQPLARKLPARWRQLPSAAGSKQKARSNVALPNCA